MKANIQELLNKLPGPVSQQWPEGQRFVHALSHGSMSVELYQPLHIDWQTPHTQDELYIIHSGTGQLVIENDVHAVEPGMVFFVPAGSKHCFENFSEGFTTWVIFWGLDGGE